MAQSHVHHFTCPDCGREADISARNLARIERAARLRGIAFPSFDFGAIPDGIDLADDACSAEDIARVVTAAVFDAASPPPAYADWAVRAMFDRGPL